MRRATVCVSVRRSLSDTFSQNDQSESEKYFLQSVHRDPVFSEVIVRLAAHSRLDEQFLQSTLEPLCICCWQQAQEVLRILGEGSATQQQLSDITKKLHACNLSSMKEISNLRAQAKGAEVHFRAHDVQLHEPLEYLDATTRELVEVMIAEKLNQLANGTARPEVVEKIGSAFGKIQDGTGSSEPLEKILAAFGKVQAKDGTRPRSVSEPEHVLEEVEELRKQVQRQVQALARQKCAVEELQSSLTESKKAEAKAVVQLEGHRQEVERMNVLVRQADKTQKARDAQVQTDVTSKYLGAVLQASVQLRETCSRLRARLGEATEDILKDSLLADIVEAHAVFDRLWDDVLLRASGSHRRQRAPMAAIAPKTILLAKELPRKPPFIASAEQQSSETSINGSSWNGTMHLGSQEQILPIEEAADVPLENITLEAEGRRVTFANILETVETPPQDGRQTPPQVAPQELPVLQGPAYLRQGKKTVSLALLGPMARRNAEINMRQWHHIHGVDSTSIATSTPASQPTRTEDHLLETVCGFLKQRRELRIGDPTAASQIPEKKPSGDAASSVHRSPSYRVSRISASISMPALERLT